MWMFWLACAEGPSPCTPTDADLDCDGDRDLDHDGDGDPAPGDGGTDCDDSDPAMNGLDADGDGWTTCELDCDESLPETAPSGETGQGPKRGPRGRVLELCDNIDNDCNGVVDVDDLGESPCQREVEYAIPERIRLDVLFVVESSFDFLLYERSLIESAESWIAPLVGYDVRVAVTTTNPGGAGVLVGTPNLPWLPLVSADPDNAVDWLEYALDQAAANNPIQLGSSEGLANAVAGASIVDFRRQGTPLTVVFVSLRDDTSTSVTPSGFDLWLRTDFWGDPKARIYGFLPLVGENCHEAAGRYQEVLEDQYPLSGLQAHGPDEPYLTQDAWSVCSTDWGAAMSEIALLDRPEREVVLSLVNQPILSTLEVELSRDQRTEVLLLEALSYDGTTNELTVPDLVWTDVDGPVTVRYQVLPTTSR